MSKINWYFIIKLPEFNSYFTQNELITLSLTCKKFRSCLKSIVLSNFNFNAFILTEDYKSLGFIKKFHSEFVDILYLYNPFITLTEDYIECTHKFKRNLMLLPRQLEKLVLFNCMDYTYLLYKFPEVFNKITTLIIKQSIIPMPLLIHLLKNFKCLNSLELSFNKFISSRSLKIDLESNWPASLRHVNIEENTIWNINTNNHIKLFHHEGTGLSMSKFNLYPYHLPNLRSFCFNASLNGATEGRLLRFLNMNPQVKRLAIHSEYHIFKIWSIIQHFEDLNYIDYSRYFPIAINYTKAPILKSVNSLELIISKKIYGTNGFSLQYPNLTRLIINVRTKNYQQISQFISNIPTLKSLKLILKYDFVFSRDLDLPKLNYLERIEFSTFDSFDNIEPMFRLCNVPNLRLVEYTKVHKCGEWKPIERHSLLDTGWGLKVFPYKRAYYKIDE